MVLAVAQRLAEQGLGVCVVDPRWVLPVDAELPDLAGRYRRVVVIEDNLRSGGIGEAIGLSLDQAGVTVPVQGFGVPSRFIDQGRRPDILHELGLSAQEIARDVVEVMVEVMVGGDDATGGDVGSKALANGAKADVAQVNGAEAIALPTKA